MQFTQSIYGDRGHNHFWPWPFIFIDTKNYYRQLTERRTYEYYGGLHDCSVQKMNVIILFSYQHLNGSRHFHDIIERIVNDWMNQIDNNARMITAPALLRLNGPYSMIKNVPSTAYCFVCVWHGINHEIDEFYIDQWMSVSPFKIYENLITHTKKADNAACLRAPLVYGSILTSETSTLTTRWVKN